MMQESKSDSQAYQCSFWADCDFIQNNLKKMPELINKTNKLYCSNPDAECARRWLREALGPTFVPPLMLPEQREWARQIIDEYNSDSMHDTQTKESP